MLAESRPTLVAVDDVQWLDTASAGALSYRLSTIRRASVSVSCCASRSGLPSSVRRRSRTVARRPGRDDRGRAARRGCAAPARPGPARRRPPTPAPRRGVPGLGWESLLRDRDRSNAPASRRERRSGAAVAGSRLAARPRRRTARCTAHGLPRLPSRRGGARSSDDRDHRGSDAGGRRRGALTGAGGRDRRARRATDSLHASAARRRRVRGGGSASDGARSTFGCRSSSRIPRRAPGSSPRRSTSRDEAVASALEEAAHHARARGAPRPAALLLDRAQRAHADHEPRRRGATGGRCRVSALRGRRLACERRRSCEQSSQRLAGRARTGKGARATRACADLRGAGGGARPVPTARSTRRKREPETLAVAHEGCRHVPLAALRDDSRTRSSTRRMRVDLALELGDEALAGEALSTCAMAELLLGRTLRARRLARRLFSRLRERPARPRSRGALPEYRLWTGRVRGRDERAPRDAAPRRRDR